MNGFLVAGRAAFVSALAVLSCAPASAGAAVDDAPPVCTPVTVVRAVAGSTIKTIRPGERIVAVRWKLSDGHTYESQTPDEDPAPGKTVVRAADELRPAGTAVKLCTWKDGGVSAYPYLIKTADGTNRAAKRLH